MEIAYWFKFLVKWHERKIPYVTGNASLQFKNYLTIRIKSWNRISDFHLIKTLGISILIDISHFILLIMIPKAKELKLISIYLYICDIFDSRLKGTCQRFSNNSNPDFNDQEVMTIYLYTMNVEQRIKIKQIYQYANDCPWFPLLPSHEAFNVRINRLSEAFRIISEILLSENCPPDRDLNTSVIVMDSLPNNYLFGKTQSFCS